MVVSFRDKILKNLEKICCPWVLLLLLLLHLINPIFSVPHSFIYIVIFQLLSYPKQKKAFFKFLLK